MRTRGFLGWVAVTLAAAAMVAAPGSAGRQHPPADQPPQQPAPVVTPNPSMPAPTAAPAPAAAPAPTPPCIADLDGMEQRLAAAQEEMRDVLAAKLQAAHEAMERALEQHRATLDRQQQLAQEKLETLRGTLDAIQAEMEARAAALGGALADQQVLEAPLPPMPEVEEWTDESGWLGVDIEEVTPDKAKTAKLPTSTGVLIGDVQRGSPADKGGLKTGDIVTRFNNEPVVGTVQFRRLVRETPPGRAARFTVWRNGTTQEISVQLGNRREQMENRVHVFGPHDFNFRVFGSPGVSAWGLFGRPMLGIAAEDISGQLGAYFAVPDGEGVLVEEVESGTPAEKAGLKAGDVITKVDDEAVKNTAELRERLAAKRDQKSVTLTVVRRGAAVSVPVELEHPKPPERHSVARGLRL